MKKIIFWDNKNPVFINDDKADAVIKANQKPGGFYLNHLGGRDWCAKGTIARVTQAHYQEYEYLLPQTNRLEAPKMPELTDEQRQANIEKFTKMKEDFIRKRAEKVAKEAADKEKKRQEILKAQEERKKELHEQLEQLNEEEKN